MTNITPQNKNLLIIIFIILIGIGAYFYVNKSKKVAVENQNTNVVNTTNIPQGWTTFTDTAQGITFQYPEKIPTNYISTVDWPPEVLLFNKSFVCTDAGSEIAQAGVTKRTLINNHVYCVTKESEGAAGSIYTNYAYEFEKDSKVVVMTFSLRFVQCANYPEPKMTECMTERNSFNIDNTADLIATSLKLE